MYAREISYSRRWLAIVLVVLTVTVAAQPVGATQRPPAQNMCAECDLLKEQLRIVIEKGEVFDDGLQLLPAYASRYGSR